MQKTAVGLMPDEPPADVTDQSSGDGGEGAVSSVKAQKPRRGGPERPTTSSSALRQVLPALRLLCIRVSSYLTNHVVAYVPSFTVRHFWYQRVMGLEIGRGAGVNMRTYVWSYGPRQIRRTGARIGRNSRIGHGCTLDLRGGLSIGNNVGVSPEVMILAGNHDVHAPGFNDAYRSVAIEDQVWIGARAIILSGVTIGRGAVVAAGSVVTKNVAEMTIVAGVPAKPIGVRAPGATVYEIEGPLPLFE